MYRDKKRLYFIIACVYWFTYMISFSIMGILYEAQVPHYAWINLGISAAGILTVLIKDRSVGNLGLSPEFAKKSLPAAAAIVAVSFLIPFFRGSWPVEKLFKTGLYFLLYIALLEEILFRGFLQSYLFGCGLSRSAGFLLGAGMFSLSHLPFQMHVSGCVSPAYIWQAAPQLIFCFFLHLILCFITEKRQDILIPTALHFALDYLQNVV